MLPIIHSQFRGFAFCTGVLLLSAVLVACAPMSILELEISGDAALPAATATVESGYPGPGATLASPLPIPPYNSLIATPLPDEYVVVGAIVEISKPKADFPYTYVEDFIEKSGIVLERVFVQYLGREIRLGDDYGSSNVEVITEGYIVWTYHAHVDETNLPLQSGLYVYEVKTGKLTRVADGWRVGLSELDGEWILYISWENARTGNLPRNDTPGDVRPLLAYNISTGQTITLTTNLPVILGRGAPSFYGVSGNRAGWVEYDMQTQQYAIKVCDLNSGNTRALNVPNLKHPLFFSLSDDLAVWRDTYWRGYSLTQDALFTIPYAPPGWENKPEAASIVVTARHSALEWQVRVSDSEVHYFSGPIVPRGQGPTAWETLAIPSQQTIAPPTPAPLEGAPPTAYP